MGRIWRKAMVAWFAISTQHLPGRVEEEQEHSQGSQCYSRISKCPSPKYKSEPVKFEPGFWIISDWYVHCFKLQNNNFLNCIFYETKDYQLNFYLDKKTKTMSVWLSLCIVSYIVTRSIPPSSDAWPACDLDRVA